MIYISHLLHDGDMRKIIQKNHVGIESIEFSIADNLDHCKEKIQEYRKRMEEIGTKKLTVHGPFLDLNPAAFDSEIRRVTALRFAQSYEAAVELGADKIIYHSCYYPKVYFLQGWAERVADFMNSFLEERNEIEVDVENVLDPTWKAMARLAELVEAPNFGLCLDVGHANCYSGESVSEWMKGLCQYIRHMHVHDNNGERDEHMAVGDGNILFPEIIKILQEERADWEDITWTIECQNYKDVDNSVKALCALKSDE